MKRTQHQQIIEYMREHDFITPMDAIYEFGCTKLSTRIGELKEAGYCIGSEMIYTEGGKHYKQYWLEDWRESNE